MQRPMHLSQALRGGCYPAHGVSSALSDSATQLSGCQGHRTVSASAMASAAIAGAGVQLPCSPTLAFLTSGCRPPWLSSAACSHCRGLSNAAKMAVSWPLCPLRQLGCTIGCSWLRTLPALLSSPQLSEAPRRCQGSLSVSAGRGRNHGRPFQWSEAGPTSSWRPCGGAASATKAGPSRVCIGRRRTADSLSKEPKAKQPGEMRWACLIWPTAQRPAAWAGMAVLRPCLPTRATQWALRRTDPGREQGPSWRSVAWGVLQARARIGPCHTRWLSLSKV